MYGDLSQPSKVNSHLIDTFIQMASSAGEDGKGKGGLTGYFKQIARREPMEMAQFLGKALRCPTVKPDSDSGDTQLTPEQIVRLTYDEVMEHMDKMHLQWAERAMEQNPIPRAILEGAASVGENGIGKNGLPGYLKRLQRRCPRAMAKTLGKVLAFPAQASAAEREHKQPTEEEVAAYLRQKEESQAALQRAQEEYDAELIAKRADRDRPDPQTEPIRDRSPGTAAQ
jgi:hypothetical protein